MTATLSGNQPAASTPMHYPLLLRLAGRPCTVVGGGRVAAGKVEGLLAAGGEITVVGPELTERLLSWFTAGRISWRPRPYREGDLAGCFLAVVATDDRDVTQRVWEEAQERSILLNAADDPAHCNFILPAVHRHGDLVVAVSSSGRAPAFSVWLRDRIAQSIGAEYRAYLDFLAGLRAEVARRFPGSAERRRAWQRLIGDDTFDPVRGGDPEAARHAADELLDRAEQP